MKYLRIVIKNSNNNKLRALLFHCSMFKCTYLCLIVHFCDFHAYCSMKSILTI